MTESAGGGVPSLKDRARGAVPFTAMAGLLQIVFSLVGMLLLVRYLRPDQYGAWMVLLGFAIPVTLALSLGHLQALLRFMPALEDGEQRRSLLWRVVARRTGIAALVFGALWLAFPFFSEWFDVGDQRAVYGWLVPGFIALVANEYLVAALNVAFRQRDTLIAMATQQILFVGGTAIGIGFGADLETFARISSLAACVQLAVNGSFCVRHYGGPRSAHLLALPGETRERRRYRVTSWVDDVGTMLLSSPVNRLVLAALATTGEVALFAVASNIVDRLTALQPLQIFRPLATVSFFARFEESGSVEDVNRMFRFVYGVNRSMTVLFFVLFFTLGRELLVFVFRPEYADAYWPAVLLCMSLAVFTMPAGMVAQTLKRPQALVWAKAAVLVNLGLGIPLTLRFGAVGMAFAAALSLLTKNVITLFVLRLEFDVRFPWSMLARYGAAGAVSIGVIEALGLIAPLYLAAVPGLAVYVVSLRVFAVLDASERALLVSLMPPRAQPATRALLG